MLFAIAWVGDRPSYIIIYVAISPAGGETHVGPRQTLMPEIEALGERLGARASINRRFIGQEQVVDLTLTAMLCGGHALLIGLPGLGKTRLVDTLSTVMGLKGTASSSRPT
jgi:hypothetical protein